MLPQELLTNAANWLEYFKSVLISVKQDTEAIKALLVELCKEDEKVCESVTGVENKKT